MPITMNDFWVGKGSGVRPRDEAKYKENHERIFGKSKLELALEKKAAEKALNNKA